MRRVYFARRASVSHKELETPASERAGCVRAETVVAAASGGKQQPCASGVNRV